MFCVDPRKAAGTVQAKIGLMILIFGYLNKNLIFVSVLSFGAYCGCACFIISGGLSGATASSRNSCLVNSALCMNVISAVVAGGAAAVFYFELKNLPSGGELPECGYWSTEPCQKVYKLGRFRATVQGLPYLSLIEIGVAIWTFVLVWKGKGST